MPMMTPLISYHLEPDICMSLQRGRQGCSNLSSRQFSTEISQITLELVPLLLPHSQFLNL